MSENLGLSHEEISTLVDVCEAATASEFAAHIERFAANYGISQKKIGSMINKELNKRKARTKLNTVIS